jgi:hypothetical protein
MRLSPAPGPASGRSPRLPRPAAPPRAADARTLYLCSAEPVRVTSTGEALVVSGQADGRVHRVPVARLLRIVCNAQAHWSGSALALCLQRGIGVAFLGRGGEPAGQLWPQQRRRLPVAETLDALAGGSEGWSEAYANWLRRERLQVLRHWQAQRREAGQPVGGDEWQQALQRWVYRAEVAAVLPAVLHGVAAALVAARLSEYGVEGHYWCLAGEPVALADDLTQLLWARMNLCAGLLAAAVEQPREAATLFEHWAGAQAGVLHAHLASLGAQARRELGL